MNLGVTRLCDKKLSYHGFRRHVERQHLVPQCLGEWDSAMFQTHATAEPRFEAAWSGRDADAGMDDESEEDEDEEEQNQEEEQEVQEPQQEVKSDEDEESAEEDEKSAEEDEEDEEDEDEEDKQEQEEKQEQEREEEEELSTTSMLSPIAITRHVMSIVSRAMIGPPPAPDGMEHAPQADENDSTAQP
ncbi:hypothetical protein PINS_up017644 [Pythium insidiosum]|nr:hypothetical protein PINS_up017644 [Pythium insidiosum]